MSGEEAVGEDSAPVPGARDGYRLQTVERAAQVLGLLLRHDAFTLKETTDALGLNTTITYRLLRTWTDLGFLEFDPRTKAYTAGSFLHQLAARIGQQRHTGEVEACLARLSAAVGHTSNVGVLIGSNIVYFARNTVRKLLMYNVEVGTLLPAHATSLGRVILAHKPESFVRTLYPREALPVFTPNTTATVSELLRELAVVRARGYAVSRWQLQVGVTSVAMPLRDHQGNVVAGINVAGSSQELSPDAIEREIVPALREASSALVWRAPDLGASLPSIGT